MEDEDGDFGSELADPEVNSTMDADEVRVVVMFLVLSFVFFFVFLTCDCFRYHCCCYYCRCCHVC